MCKPINFGWPGVEKNGEPAGTSDPAHTFESSYVEISTYPVVLPELDHPIGRIDAKGPASPGRTDGIAGCEALPQPQ